MLHRIFGKRRPAETVSFLAAVAAHHRDPVSAVIAGGRYLVFAPDADGRAVLLLQTNPPLIACVLRPAVACGSATMVVEWVCEASADHRHHLTVANFRSCCVAAPAAGHD